MSKGPGRVQREILALIAAEPGPWSVEELCGVIYPSDSRPTRSQLNSLTRVLRMRLPGRWTFGKIWPDCRWWLFDASRRRNDVSVRMAVTEPMRAFEVELDGEGRVVRVIAEAKG